MFIISFHRGKASDVVLEILKEEFTKRNIKYEIFDHNDKKNNDDAPWVSVWKKDNWGKIGEHPEKLFFGSLSEKDRSRQGEIYQSIVLQWIDYYFPETKPPHTRIILPKDNLRIEFGSNTDKKTAEEISKVVRAGFLSTRQILSTLLPLKNNNTYTFEIVRSGTIELERADTDCQSLQCVIYLPLEEKQSTIQGLAAHEAAHLLWASAYGAETVNREANGLHEAFAETFEKNFKRNVDAFDKIKSSNINIPYYTEKVLFQGTHRIFGDVGLNYALMYYLGRYLLSIAPNENEGYRQFIQLLLLTADNDNKIRSVVKDEKEYESIMKEIKNKWNEDIIVVYGKYNIKGLDDLLIKFNDWFQKQPNLNKLKR